MNSPVINFRNMWSIIAIILFMGSVFVKADFDFSRGDTILLRATRDVQGGSTDGTEDVKNLNLAEAVDDDFPVVFNMLLWLGISLAIATLAICVAIATMDPGRDSLIYRVTSGQRFKKDN